VSVVSAKSERDVALDKEEARAIGAAKIDELRTLSYQELLRFMDPVHQDVMGASGTDYQVEVLAFWDGGRRARDGNLHVIVSVDDGGWSAVSPLTSDFIIAPTGEFIGE
jgi:hypothetical protein